jgi:hypothetical protein
VGHLHGYFDGLEIPANGLNSGPKNTLSTPSAVVYSLILISFVKKQILSSENPLER